MKRSSSQKRALSSKSRSVRSINKSQSVKSLNNSNLSMTPKKRKFSKEETKARNKKPVNMGLSKNVRGRILMTDNDDPRKKDSSAKKEKEKEKKEAKAQKNTLSPCLRQNGRSVTPNQQPSRKTMKSPATSTKSVSQKSTGRPDRSDRPKDDNKNASGKLYRMALSPKALSQLSGSQTLPSPDKNRDQTNNETTLLAIREMTNDVKSITQDIEDASSRQERNVKSKLNDIALDNLKSNIEAVQSR